MFADLIDLLRNVRPNSNSAGSRTEVRAYEACQQRINRTIELLASQPVAAAPVAPAATDDLPPTVDRTLYNWGQAILSGSTDDKVRTRKDLIAAIRASRDEAVRAALQQRQAPAPKVIVSLGDTYADACKVCDGRGHFGIASQKGPEGCAEALCTGEVYCEAHLPRLAEAAPVASDFMRGKLAGMEMAAGICREYDGGWYVHRQGARHCADAISTQAGMLSVELGAAPVQADEPFGYWIVEGDDLPYPGAGFVRTLTEGWQYRSVTPLYKEAVAQAAPAPTAEMLTEILTPFLRREMPAGTVVVRSDWWAVKIARAVSAELASRCRAQGGGGIKEVSDLASPSPHPVSIGAGADKLKAAILAALEKRTKEMEGYSYFGSNPGVDDDDYEDVADDVIAAIAASPATQHETGLLDNASSLLDNGAAATQQEAGNAE